MFPKDLVKKYSKNIENITNLYQLNLQISIEELNSLELNNYPINKKN